MLMTKLNIRPVQQGDITTLAQVKSDYVRRLYRGFVPQEVLKTATPAYYTQELTQWLESGRYRIAVLESEGAIRAFTSYADDPDDAHSGLIYESACDQATSSEEKRALVDHVIQLFRQEERSQVHLWVLRDNFHVRFLFETLGFRPDGARQAKQFFGEELTITRYVYKL